MTMRILSEKEQMDKAIDGIDEAISEQKKVTEEAREKYEFASQAVFWLSSGLLKKKAFYEHSVLILNHLSEYRDHLITVKRDFINRESL
jgi:hypothetical protein